MCLTISQFIYFIFYCNIEQYWLTVSTQALSLLDLNEDTYSEFIVKICASSSKSTLLQRYPRDFTILSNLAILTKFHNAPVRELVRELDVRLV